MRTNHFFSTRIRLFCAATLLFALCGRATGQGAAPQQDQDSTKGRVTSRGTIEIVSGHDGLDSNRYMGEVFQKLNSQGTFQARNVPGGKSGKVVVEFVVLRDGSLGSAKIMHSTVDQAISQAQVDAIRSAAPFPALPEKFKGKSLKMRLHSEFLERPPAPNH